MTDQLRILIVEDEFLTMEALRDALEGMGYGIAGDAMRADEALGILKEGQTDLAILDVHIKGARSGIWLAEQIRERYDIPFIFLTAFGDKATIADAARTQPGSYLVKPFVEQDLHAAIELAVNSYNLRRQLPLPAPATSSLDVEGPTAPASPRQTPETTAVAPSEPAEFPNRLLIDDSIFVKDDLVFRRIAVADIQLIQSFRNYLEITVTQKRKYLLRSTLRAFLQQLPPEHFVQTHRSYAVNLRRVNRIGGNFVGVDDLEVPLSQDVRQQIIQRLKMF